jgi:hypothetical protein
MEDIFELLFPSYMDHRALLKLSRVCKRFYSIISSECGVFYEYAASVKVRTKWRNVGKTSLDCKFPMVPSSTWMSYAYALQYYPSCQSNSFIWVPQKQNKANILKQLSTTLCRECFAHTTCKAYTLSTRRKVIVCKNCSRDSDNFSALCDRSHVIELYNGSTWKRKKKYVLQYLRDPDKLAAIGGNMSHLFWLHDVQIFFDGNK